MKVPKLNTKKYIFITSLFMIVLIGSLVIGGNCLSQFKEENEKKLYLANQYSHEVDKITALIQDYNDSSSRVDQVRGAIPDRESVVDVVDQLESIGSILGVDTTVSFFDGVVDEEGIVVSAVSEGTEGIVKYTGVSGVEVLEVGVDIKGELSQIVNYMGMVQELKYYTNITSIQVKKFEPQENESTTPYVEGLFTIMLFVEKGGTRL